MDLFIAYGVYVAVAVAFAVSVLIGAGVRWMSGRPDRELWFGIHAAVLFPLFYQESNFSLMTGSLLWVFFVVCAIHLVSKFTLASAGKLTGER